MHTATGGAAMDTTLAHARLQRHANIAAARALLRYHDANTIEHLLHENRRSAAADPDHFQREYGEVLPPHADLLLDSEVSMLEALTRGISELRESSPTAEERAAYRANVADYLEAYERIVAAQHLMLADCRAQYYVDLVARVRNDVAEIPL